MIKTISVLLLLLIPFLSSAQEKGKNNNITYEQRNTNIMEGYIKQLKDGVLLFRLMTKKNSINELTKEGNQHMADAMAKKQSDYNKSIVKAFKGNFTFCPVYFFFSSYSENIRNNEFDKIEFLNDSLEPDTSIKINNERFLTAEIATIDQDTAQYYDGRYYYSDENGLDRKTSYYGSSSMDFEALLIKSDKFIQLKRPFPYYERTYDQAYMMVKLVKVVQKMNAKLFKYYEMIKNRTY